MREIICRDNVYHLRNDHISYILAVLPGGVVAHIHAGARVESASVDNLLCHLGLSEAAAFSVQEMALEKLTQEYPSFGLGDMKEGALTARCADGSTAVDLRFASAEITEGKPKLVGLPATFGDDCATLKLTLQDAHTGLVAELYYTIFDDCDAVARSARLINAGDAPLTLTRALSFCLDLPDSGYELITLSGAWIRERSVVRRALVPGEQGVASRNGASSHQASPFLALVRPGTNEFMGETMGLSLIYSGNFLANVTVGQYGTARAVIGINDRDFTWLLAPGEAFQTPEAVLVYSREGLGGMSRNFHRLWNRHLLPQRWVRRPRPILLNNWEATYFDFDEDKLVAIAEAAKAAGAELFVMDDGWFGHRDDDWSSLGDWTVDKKKLPGGLKRLGDRVRALGLQFGIWMEPEMVNPDSDLYRAHPEWTLQIPGREPICSRHQLTLDMGRRDVQDFVIEAVTRTLNESGAVYLKWDMNRNFSNIGATALPAERQGEVPHRYILGLYRVMEALVEAFPDVLFEGCASGGGRFDAGLLYYVPQYWCSDNTDCLSRCEIQYGTTMAFPPATMGSHVSAVPNHQTGRITPLETRFAVALGGQFGYELDPTRLSDADRAEMHRQTDYARATAQTRLNGDYYRLLSPFEDNDTAWMSVSEDKSEAVFTIVRAHALSNLFPRLVRLAGLDPDFHYTVMETGATFTGSELMTIGLACPLGPGDAASLIYTLKAE